MPIGITFVDTNTTTKAHPGGGSRVVTNVSADTKRSIRSHAARSAHARSRLERTAQYQAEIRDVERTDSNDGNSGTSTSTAATLPATAPSPKVALPLTRVPDVRGASFAAALAGLYASFSPFGDKAAVYISPFEQFLVDHFARWVVRYEVPHCSDGTSRERHGQLMLTRWMPLVLADRGALAALCLCACRSLALPATATAPTLSAAMQGLEQHQQLQLPYTRDQQQRRQQEQQNVTQSWTPQQQMYTRRALAYKAECIKSVNEAIARRGWRAGDTVIAQVLMLALDEFRLGDVEMTRAHIQAVEHMVNAKGATYALSFRGFLRQLVTIFVNDVVRSHSSSGTPHHPPQFEGPDCEAVLLSLSP